MTVGVALTKVAVVHVGADDDDLSDCAIRLDDRVAALRRLAPHLGLSVVDVPARAVVDAPPGAEAVADVLAGSSAVWWFGRMAFLPEMRALWAALEAHAHAVGLRSDALHDPPEHVDEAFDLSRHYPLLARAGLPQAGTRFYPLSSAELALAEAPLRRALARRLRWLWMGSRGRFFRTFYGTRKLHHGALNAARTKDELISGVADMLLALRDTQAVGGVAVRDLLELDGSWGGAGHWFSREYRVFVARGEPVMWLCHADLEQARRILSPDEQRRAAPSAAQLEAMLDHARRAGRVLRASLVSVDFAVLRSGGLTCVEVNPGHCSGWGAPAAFVRVHGELLRRLAGLPPLDRDGSLAIARAAGLDLSGLGDLFDFVS